MKVKTTGSGWQVDRMFNVIKFCFNILRFFHRTKQNILNTLFAEEIVLIFRVPSELNTIRVSDTVTALTLLRDMPARPQGIPSVRQTSVSLYYEQLTRITHHSCEISFSPFFLSFGAFDNLAMVACRFNGRSSVDTIPRLSKAALAIAPILRINSCPVSILANKTCLPKVPRPWTVKTGAVPLMHSNSTDSFTSSSASFALLLTSGENYVTIGKR